MGGSGEAVAVLANAAAGRGRATVAAAELVAALRAQRVPVLPLVSPDPAQALAAARAAVAGGLRALVAVGGDGTANLAIQAVAEQPVPFAVLPVGTGNDLAHCLGFQRDPAALAAAVACGRTRGVDAVRTSTGRWWGAVLASGFDSAVNDRANRMRWPRGRLRYDLATLLELRRLHPLPFRVVLDDELVLEQDAICVAVGNGPSYGGGLRMCPAADPADGLLDVVVVGGVPRWELVRMFPSLYRGGHVGHPQVSVYRSRTVRLECPGVTAYADGEPLGPLPLSCEVVPGALRVVLPPH